MGATGSDCVSDIIIVSETCCFLKIAYRVEVVADLSCHCTSSRRLQTKYLSRTLRSNMHIMGPNTCLRLYDSIEGGIV